MKTKCTFFIISRSVLLRVRNVSDKSCTEIQNTHFVFSNFFFANRTVCEIMWKKYGWSRQVTADNMKWHTRIACRTPKTTNTHSQYIILIDFSTATMVARTGLNATLHVHYCLSCHTFLSLPYWKTSATDLRTYSNQFSLMHCKLSLHNYKLNRTDTFINGRYVLLLYKYCGQRERECLQL